MNLKPLNPKRPHSSRQISSRLIPARPSVVPILLFTCSTWLGCSGDSRPTTGPPDPVQAERIVVDGLDREWELIGFVIADALLDSIIDESRVTLTLHSDGTLGGRGGCNGYGGSWSQPSEGGLAIDGDSYPRRVGVGAQFVGR